MRRRIVSLILALFILTLAIGTGVFLVTKYRSSADTTVTPIPEIAQVTALNAQIKTSLANRTKLPTTGVHNTTCKQLAQRAPLLASVISQVPEQAQSFFFDAATLANIKPLNCPTGTVEQPNTMISGGVQIIAESSPSTVVGPTDVYAVTTSDNKHYSVVFNDYQKPTNDINIPRTGQSIASTGTLIDQTLITNSSSTAINAASVTRSAGTARGVTILGTHKILVVFFSFTDSKAISYQLTDSSFQGRMSQAFQANQSFWDQATWNKIHFQGQSASTPADFRFQNLGVAPINLVDCHNGQTKIQADDWLSAQLATVGSGYDNIIGIAPFASTCTTHGWGQRSGNVVILNGNDVAEADVLKANISHELGHNLSLRHGADSSYPANCHISGSTDINCARTFNEYGDVFNIMGNNSTETMYPSLDIPGLDKQVLGVISSDASGAATITSANTAANPVIAKLYSLEGNPTNRPNGTYQHFEVSSSYFTKEYATQKVDIEYRPLTEDIKFHLDTRSSATQTTDFMTYLIPDAHLFVNGSYTLSGVKFEFLSIDGDVATVRISVPPSCPTGTEAAWLSATPVTPTTNLSPGDTVLFKLTVTGCTLHTTGLGSAGTGDDGLLVTWPSANNTTFQAYNGRIATMLFSATGAANGVTGLPNGLNIVLYDQSAVPPIQANQPVTYYTYYTISPNTTAGNPVTVGFGLVSDEIMGGGFLTSYTLPPLKAAPTSQTNLNARNITISPDPAGPVPFTNATTSTPVTYAVTYNATNVTNGATATAAVYLPSGNGWTVTSNTQMVTFSAAQKTFTDTIKIVPPTNLGPGIYRIPILVRGYANGTTTNTVIYLTYNGGGIKVIPGQTTKSPYLGSSIPLIK